VKDRRCKRNLRGKVKVKEKRLNNGNGKVEERQGEVKERGRQVEQKVNEKLNR